MTVHKVKKKINWQDNIDFHPACINSLKVHIFASMFALSIKKWK
jgi:hypothetical protein